MCLTNNQSPVTLHLGQFGKYENNLLLGALKEETFGSLPDCPAGGFLFLMTTMTKEIKLTQGKVALVDKEDFLFLRENLWHVNKRPNGRFYAARGLYVGPYNTKSIQMHRVVMCALPGEIIDHINRDGLDNRKCNLRFCTTSQNLMNSKIPETKGKTSVYKGVYWDKSVHKWKASIKKNGKRLYLGRFDNEIEAARTYDDAAKKYFGEFARPNF